MPLKDNKAKKKDVSLNETLERQLSFYALLADISIKMVNLAAEDIDPAIENAMMEMINFFDVDRCHIGIFSEETKEIKLMYFQSRPGDNIPPVPDISRRFTKYVYKQLSKGNSIVYEKLEKMPDEAREDADFLKKIGVKSLVIIPVSINKEYRFSLSLTSLRNPRSFEKFTLDQIKTIGGLLANVIQRSFVLEKIAEEKAWNEAILQGMPQIAYVFDEESRLVRWNKNAEHVFGYSEQEMKGRPAMLFSDPAYRKKVDEAMQKVFTSGEEQIVETVYITKSGRSFPVYGNGKLVIINGKKYLIGLAVDLTELKQAQHEIKEQLEEIQKLKEQLEAENYYLKQELNIQHSFDEIVGESNILKYSLYRLEQVAPTDSTVLLEGETGTGKELFAHALHQLSKRKEAPLITVNCAAIPPTLFESELFGHEKGAFTGANKRKIGRFELADKGTIFFDEISEMPLELQAKLLRALQEGEFERVGSAKTRKVNVRIIAASNRDLLGEVNAGRFRKDLFFRLNVYPITIAPLRERPSDIPLLVEHFVRRFNRKLAKNITTIPKKVMESLQQYSWPGNVRELENVIERAVILSNSSTLFIESLKEQHINDNGFKPLTEFERDYIIKVLEHTYWRVDGPNGAARILDMHPETLRSRMRKLGINRPASANLHHHDI